MTSLFKFGFGDTTSQKVNIRESNQNVGHMDLKQEGRSALHFAAANGHLATVKALINSGANVNARDVAGYSPLHQAATEGHEEVVLLLLKSGCLVNTQDELHGNTALHEAAWKGYSRTVEVLCKYKANVYIKNNGGFTPLHLACQNGHNQCCRILLLSACKPDIRNSYGDTPLHTAARYGHAGVLRILLSAFCNVNETNKNGDSALHIAAAMGRRKLTKILLEAGCDQNLKNNQNETCRDIAVRKEFSEIVELLDRPPVTLIPILEKESKKPKKNLYDQKKCYKESGASQESSTKEKKVKKSKKGHKVHFSMVDSKKNSPYGCHMFPDLEYFPSVNLKSLPSEPLKKGEQYYADLAGNVKKGPRGLGYVCYCAPFFNHVEKKLNENKEELLNCIKNKSEDLKTRLNNLEQRTHCQLVSLNQKVKENIALERIECCERIDRRLLKERQELLNEQEKRVQSLQLGVKSWMDLKKDKISESKECKVTVESPQSNFFLTRSKSADLLSENDSHQFDSLTCPSASGVSSVLQEKDCIDLIPKAKNLYLQDKPNSVKPKYNIRNSRYTSKAKFRFKDYSLLSRDSRSEGDLTNCHSNEEDEKNDSKNQIFSSKLVQEKSLFSCALNQTNQNAQLHFLPKDTAASENGDGTSTHRFGHLWNRNRKSTEGKIKNKTSGTENETLYCTADSVNTYQHGKSAFTKCNQSDLVSSTVCGKYVTNNEEKSESKTLFYELSDKSFSHSKNIESPSTDNMSHEIVSSSFV